MAINTGISWAHHSQNWWQSCTKMKYEVGGEEITRPECMNCYMFREKAKYGQSPIAVVRSKSRTFDAPLRIQRNIDRGLIDPTHNRVFVSSWTDFNHPEADPWRADAWQMMLDTPGLIYMILTKRAKRFDEPGFFPPFWDKIRQRIWLGVTVGVPGVENDILYIRGRGVPVRFVSAEPLLGIPALGMFMEDIDWLIVGGESGPKLKTRPSLVENFVALQVLAEATKTPLFFKQQGSYMPIVEFSMDSELAMRQGKLYAVNRDVPLDKVQIRDVNEALDVLCTDGQELFVYAGMNGLSGGITLNGQIIQEVPEY